jgi:hypothetical protein
MIVRTITYTSPGGTVFNFASATSAIASVEGLYAPPTNISSQKAPFQDGSTFTGLNFEEREIVLTVGYIGAFSVPAIQAYRRALQSACNPKENDRLGEGVLSITEDGVVREFRCVVDSVVMPSISRQARNNDTTITFLCSDPYAYSDTTQSQGFTITQPTYTWTFPHILGPNTGFTVVGLGGVDVVSSGDESTGIIATINGPCDNPKLANNTTGEYIKILLSLIAGDVLVIDMENATVFLNGQTAIKYLDIASSFWKLQPGTNLIKFSEDNISSTATASITWQDRYIGF